MKQFFKFFFASLFGTITAVFLLLAILVGIAGIIAVSVEDDKEEISENSILCLDFEMEMTDRASDNPFENFDFTTFSSEQVPGLNQVLENIRKASKDEHIKGIFMDINLLDIGMSRTNEIRAALAAFREGGKFIYTYGDFLNQNAYYLATAGDKIYLHPGGLIELNGLTSQGIFLKGSLDKIGVDIQVIRHGKFKSAVEPLTRESMSEENRLQTEAFVGSLWNNMVREIAKSRKLQEVQIQDYANTLAVGAPEKAVEQGLIDGVRYRDEVLDELRKLTGLGEDEDPEFVKLREYDRVEVEDGEKSLEDFKNKVAIVYASGDIGHGESDDNTMGSETISTAIGEARKDSSVKAVVLRVNSPGGSSLASDIIWREVELTKKVKPVVVSMGDLAASGGYYISCGANKILADENTITGSIGVFGIIPNAKKLLNEKLGVTIDTVNTNTYSDLASPFRPLKALETEYISLLVERIYNDFVSKVSVGRAMTYEEVDEIGQGRVWSGSDALKIGLVDEIGGLERAVELAAELAKVKKYSWLELPEQKSPFQSIISDFTDDVEASIVEKHFVGYYGAFSDLYRSFTEGGIYMRLPFGFMVE